MAFWKDRIVEYPNRYKDQNNNVYDFTRDEGTVTESGTFFNANNMNNLASGWTAILEILTYSSWDSGTRTGVVTTTEDLTSYLSVGMKVKFTQATVKYAIITAITSSTITFYFGTDYTLANASITDVFFSPFKAPFGFPLAKNKWTISVTVSSNTYGSPSNDTWWNPGTTKITVPIGLWKLSYKARPRTSATISSNGFITNLATLSTTNNSETISFYTAGIGQDLPTSGTYIMTNTFSLENEVSVSVATDYFLLHKIITSGSVTANQNGFNSGTTATVLQATCAYL